jgi:hypothetical protein
MSEERTVRNIYRRPSRRNKGKPRVNSVCELKRKQFARSSRSECWEDDGDEVPAKPALTFTTSDTSSIVRKSSILRRPRSKSVPAVSHRNRAPVQEGGNKKCVKQTSFREDVEVIYYDEEGTPVSNLSCQSEKLKSSCEELELHNEDLCDINKNCLEGPNGPVVKHKEEREEKEEEAQKDEETRPRDIKGSATASTLVSCCLSGVVVHPSDGGRPLRGICIKIEIDKDCIRNRTKVKVLSSGASVLVMTYKEGRGDLEETIERIDLPVTIDPYSVKAQVKANGSLTVEAPIKT